MIRHLGDALWGATDGKGSAEVGWGPAPWHGGLTAPGNRRSLSHRVSIWPALKV